MILYDRFSQYISNFYFPSVTKSSREWAKKTLTTERTETTEVFSVVSVVKSFGKPTRLGASLLDHMTSGGTLAFSIHEYGGG
jgi:hypothetical protein